MRNRIRFFRRRETKLTLDGSPESITRHSFPAGVIFPARHFGCCFFLGPREFGPLRCVADAASQ